VTAGTAAAGRHVLLRADASAVLGIGHVVRAQTLAAALMAAGWRATIVTSDLPAGLEGRIDDAGIGLLRLSPGSSARTEPVEIADRLGPDVALVVADHYGLDASWFEAIHARFPAAIRMAVDDLADRPLPVELVLNQNLGAADGAYAALVPAGSRVLAGPSFALLRPEFAALRARGRVRDGRIERILVSFGGADPPDVTGRAVVGLDGIGVPVDVVVGAAYPHLARLRSIMADQPTTTLHVDTASIAELMDHADLAVGAAGTASWERCSLGLPAVIVRLADNQRDVTAALVAAGAAQSLGWHATITAADVAQAVRALRSEPERVAAMSVAAAAVTDGLGAGRVVDVIESIVGRGTEAT
jgi:UDP-2,4-diacetamido-2,4,6-trideoxy-beta-L-altropyranose hydrolase